MKISTKGRYGLRAMVDLAINSGKDHVALNCIAERQDVSENYLEQVFSALRKANLVKSVKGAQGGYILADNPSNITVGRVLRVLEGDLSIVDEDEIGGISNDNMEYCLKINVWDKINKSINSVVDSITLEDLADWYRSLSCNMQYMFYI